jgi:ElaA protein
MGKALDYCRQYWPTEPITISAQQHLQKFYSELGFVTESAPYLEDGIPHIQMRYESLPG